MLNSLTTTLVLSNHFKKNFFFQIYTVNNIPPQMLFHDPLRSRFYTYVRYTVITLSFHELKMIYSRNRVDPPTKQS